MLTERDENKSRYVYNRYVKKITCKIVYSILQQNNER